MGSSSRAPLDLDFRSPGKRARKNSGAADRSPAVGPPAGPQTSPLAPAHERQQQAAPPQDLAEQGLQEAGGSNEGTLAAAAAGGEATVTDAATAFRELRVRPARNASPGPHRSGAGGAAATAAAPGGAAAAAQLHVPERPPSPKKRKASYNIDKEFILKDDKVKRNTDTQGDISQARGQLGQLLFEFSQIELNKDLLDAIRRTESKTGRGGAARAGPPAPGRLDRAAFELAVADAAELLQAQLSDVEAHCADAGVCKAILRSYAVQAIATFADEDTSSDEDEGSGGTRSSSDDENADSNSRRQPRAGSSSQEGPAQHSAQHGALSGEAGSHSLDAAGPPRPGSAAACHSPAQGRPHVGAGLTSPSRQPAASAAEASSSFLPDAPSESALEDTATAGLQQAQQQAQQGEQQQQEPQHAGDEDGGGMQARMRMLSLEAEGSAHQQQSSAVGGGEDDDGPADMIRSPAPVTSRRMPLAPAVPALGGAGVEHGGAGSRRTSPAADAGGRMAAVLEEARQLTAGRPHRQQRQPSPARPQQRQPSPARPQQQPEEQQQESSEGASAGQASSGLPVEPPKRQRRSGALLPPVYEHSSQQRRAAQTRRASDPGAAAAAAAAAVTATQRAAIFGSIQPRAAGEQQPQEEEQQQQQPGADGPRGASPAVPHPSAAGQAAAGAAGGAAQEEEEAPQEGGAVSDAAAQLGLPRAAHSGSSVWGSTLVCADLTLNDVASQYWPFLRSAMQGQAAGLQEGDKALVEALVRVLGDTIADTYRAAAHSGRRPAAEVCSLVAATAFDDFFRAKGAAESSGASL